MGEPKEWVLMPAVNVEPPYVLAGGPEVTKAVPVVDRVSYDRLRAALELASPIVTALHPDSLGGITVPEVDRALAAIRSALHGEEP